jgi:hypothetical protein
MDPMHIYVALINAGGLGILSAVLFYLHVSALKVFREELSEERKQCHEDHIMLAEAVDANQVSLTRLLERK